MQAGKMSYLACAAVLGAMVAGPISARPLSKPPANAGEALIRDVATLAQQRPRACKPSPAAGSAAPGWQELPSVCAWQGLLQVRRWRHTAGPSSACVSAPAAWWHWERQRLGVADPVRAAWHAGWSSQQMTVSSGPLHHLFILETDGAIGWEAVEWTWSPSPRAATRAWQAKRWNLLAESTASRRPAPAANRTPSPALMLREAWQKNLQNRAGEIDGPDWRWKSAGTCMRMMAIATGESQLALPYSREDVRQELRAAMQIQLARRLPSASWPLPFHVLALPAGNARAGAKYAAVWIDQGAVTGQLWIPVKNGGAPIRTRIQVGLPAQQVSADDSAALAAAVERELSDIAKIWSAEHER